MYMKKSFAVGQAELSIRLFIEYENKKESQSSHPNTQPPPIEAIEQTKTEERIKPTPKTLNL